MLNDLILGRLLKFDRPSRVLDKEQQLTLDNFKSKCNSGYYSFESVACLCGSTGGILVTKRDRYNLAVETLLCKTCGLMRTSPRLNESSLSLFYNEDYRSIYVGSTFSVEDFFKSQVQNGRNIFDFVSRYQPLESAKTIYDIGCGAGGTLVPFKEHGCAVFGSDLGASYLEEGRKYGLTLEHGTEESLKKYGAADLVILSHVVEHFSNPLLSLSKIRALVKDDGLLYVEVPGVFTIHSLPMGPLDYFQNAHLYHFTLKSLTALLELAGFELVAGNNFVQGLFRKSQTTTKFRTPEKWYLILGYLYFTQLNHRLNLINLYRNYVLNPKRIFSLPKLLLVTSAQKIFGKERYLRIKNGILNR